MKTKPRYKVTYVIREKINSWHVRDKLKFNTFDELKTYLIENTNELFGWDNFNNHGELPNFKDVETVRDINTILDKYNYGWWYLKVKIIAVEQEHE